MATNNEQDKVKQFIANCDELIDCNFLVSETKMQKVLASLADTKPVYDLIAECLEQFNREREMVKAFVEDGRGRYKCVMPTEEYKIIGLVFCVLANISRGEIDFTDFVKRYFSTVEGVHCYKQFAKQFITPFRNLIADAFKLPLRDVETNTGLKKEPIDFENLQRYNPDHSETEEYKKLKEQSNIVDMRGRKVVIQTVKNREPVEGLEGLCYRLENIAKQMKRELELNDKADSMKINEVKCILNAILMMCDDQDFDVLRALNYAIKYSAKCFKNMRFLIKEFDDEINAYYKMLLNFDPTTVLDDDDEE